MSTRRSASLEIPLTQPRIAGESGTDVGAFFVGQPVALEEGQRVILERKPFGFVQNLSQRFVLQSLQGACGDTTPSP